MSDILFLIGNGFDINLGLNTEYNDIRNEYIKQYENSDDENLKKFASELKINKNEMWSNFEEAMGEHTKFYNKCTIKNYEKRIDTFKEVMITKILQEESRIITDNYPNEIYNMFKQSMTKFHSQLKPESKNSIQHFISPSKTNTSFNYGFIVFNYTDIIERCIKIIRKREKAFNFRSFSNGQIYDILGNVIYIHGTVKEDFIET